MHHHHLNMQACDVPTVFWLKRYHAPKKNAILSMIRQHATRHFRKPLKERAAHIIKYLAKQPYNSLPLTVHIGNTLIFTKPSCVNQKPSEL
jgi:hypothetical protein